jgi:hypothetical protein
MSIVVNFEKENVEKNMTEKKCRDHRSTLCLDQPECNTRVLISSFNGKPQALLPDFASPLKDSSE